MSGELLTGVDWSNDAHWSSAAKPVDNDDAIMSDVQTSNVTTGLASALDLDLDLLYLPERFLYSLGSTSSPIATAADLVRHYGPGFLFYECDNGAGAAVTDEVRISCSQASGGAELGSLAGNAGTFTKIIITRGKVLLKANIEFTDTTGTVEMKPIGGENSNVMVTLTEGADALPILIMDGGVLDSSGAITVATQRGGKLVQRKAAITTLNLKAGECEYEWSAGTTVTVHTGAKLNLMTNAVKKVFTTLNAYDGAIIEHDSLLHTFTAFNRLGVEG